MNKVKIEVIDTQKEDRTENLQKKLSGKTMLERRYEQELMKVKAAADAELEDRVKRAVELYGLDAKNVESAVLKTDKKRAGYYNYFTGRKWGKLENYDLSINTSKISLDDVVEILKSYVEKR